MRYCSDRALRCLADTGPGQNYVIAQLGQSLDGRIATPTGESRTINGAAALNHLHRLRSRVDAVVVGVGTVVADDPLLTVRRVDGENPARVVIDLNARLPLSCRLLTNREARTVVVRAVGQPPAECETLYVEAEKVGDASGSRSASYAAEPDAILAVLADIGLRRVLIEGGATTIGKFLAAGALDRLHLLVAPIVLGSGRTGLDLPPIDKVDESLRPTVRPYLFDDGDVLFDCDLRDTKP